MKFSKNKKYVLKISYHMMTKPKKIKKKQNQKYMPTCCDHFTAFSVRYLYTTGLPTK